MADITKDEWYEWRHMPQTEEFLRELEERRLGYLEGYVTMRESLWVGQLYECSGMKMAISLAANIGEEE